MSESCAHCGHIPDGICDIHNSKLMYADENHGCTYWQDKSAICPQRCGNCSAFKFTTPAKTWGICDIAHSRKNLHRNTFACALFYKEGEENVPKQTYYTKCGREFQKNSTAVVTGFHIEEYPSGLLKGHNCETCPFIVDVTEGWGENRKHIRYECRAGSQPPNHKTEWTGSLEDKNTISIHSLDNQLMEEIKEYCEKHPGLGAGYNADHMADCRRTLAINCSSNKKGMAAKKELVEKFFPEDKEEISLTSDEGLYYCEKEDCPFNDREDGCCFAQEDHDECFAKDLISAIKDYDCENENVQFAYKLIRPEAHIEEEEDPACETEEFQTSSGSGSCVSGTAEIGVISSVDKPTATIAEDSKEEKEGAETMENENACPYGKLDLDDCHCINEVDGLIVCDAIRRKGWDRYHYVKEMEHYNIDCAVFKRLAAEIIAEKKPEKPAETKAIEEVTTNVITFDYSTVDEETGAFLQEKAQKITEIRIKSVIALGKELKEAQDKLSSHKTGTFGTWSQSIGFSRQTVQNYIQAYDYIVKNFDNIDSAENIQPSLLFAASKPSAPAELQQGVLSGDITTYKQYKELEQKLKDAELHYENVKNSYERLEKTNSGHYQRLTQLETQNRSLLRDYETGQTKLKDLQQQLEQAKTNGSFTKVRELGQKIAEYQEQVDDLRKQLHDKPIEVAATEVVEKEIIPDEVAEAIYCKIKYLYESIANLSEKEIQIFVDHVDPSYYDDISSTIDDATLKLERIQAYALVTTNIAEPDGHCGDCVHADMDAVTEEQLDEGKTRCTVTGKIVDIMDGCGKYKSYREGQS